jgi:hypothetical protein
MNNYMSFSKSPIWDLQRRYFEEQGIEAWRDSEVPYYITNNSLLANAYVEMVFGFLKDWARDGNDVKEPIYLLEVGGGTGRCAYFMLKSLESLYMLTTESLPPIRYIWTDLPQKNVDFCASHPRFATFVQNETLDFARFDVEQDNELYLIHSKKLITTSSLTQPIIVIANYFFDSIPQDLFFFRNGQAFECQVSLEQPEPENTDSITESLTNLQLKYGYLRVETIDTGNHYKDQLLEEYQKQIATSHVLVPFVGFDVLERIRRFSQVGFMLLSADKGPCNLQELDGLDTPKLVTHGSFSLNVNYHAMGYLYELQQGKAHFPTHKQSHLNTVCLLMVPNADAFGETRQAYARYVDRFSPDDYFQLKKAFFRHLDHMDFHEILSFLRLSCNDPRLYVQCLPRLLKLSSELRDADKHTLFTLTEQVWDWYYDIGDQEDLAFLIGTLLYQMDFYEEAIGFYQNSLQKDGPLYYNMGICYYRLMKDEECLVCMELSLGLDPESVDAKRIIHELERNDI